MACRLENNTIKEILTLLWRFWTPCQTFQPRDPTRGLGPQRILPWGSMGFDNRPLRGAGKRKSLVLEGKNKILCTSRCRGEEQWPHRRLRWNYLLVLEGLLWRHGSAESHHRDEGTGRSPLCKPCWNSPLTLPSSPRAQGWVTSGQTTARKGVKPHPSADHWIKALLSKALPTRARPSFPHCQSLPLRSLHKSLSLIHQRADRRNKKHSLTEAKTKTILWKVNHHDKVNHI